MGLEQSALSVEFSRESATEFSETAADLAAAAALLEIGDRLGLLPYLDKGQWVTGDELATRTELPASGITNYLATMAAAGIMTESVDDPGRFQVVPTFPTILYEAGYLSWALTANRPFIENAVEFLQSASDAGIRHRRDGRQVAVSTQWVGSKGFYPATLETLVDARPKHLVDLGCGTARLLIDILLRLKDATAVAVDVDAGACREAANAANRAGVADRLEVIQRSVQSVAIDPAPLVGADAIHGGFVFHDMFPEEATVADGVLASCRESLRPGGLMAITDAVPYAPDPGERRFSALFTYYHQQFMGRQLLPEEEWMKKLTDAGFSDVECIRHRLPTGRLFVGKKIVV
ncbi:methyltransferase [Nocardia sp. NBC_01499]|uniref:methyltransferase n=1 Tax=Nocardia sp. NBC_01499 TaxID=2903597 RepID=UPI0038648462